LRKTLLSEWGGNQLLIEIKKKEEEKGIDSLKSNQGEKRSQTKSKKRC